MMNGLHLWLALLQLLTCCCCLCVWYEEEFSPKVVSVHDSQVWQLTSVSTDLLLKEFWTKSHLPLLKRYIFQCELICASLINDLLTGLTGNWSRTKLASTTGNKPTMLFEWENILIWLPGVFWFRALPSSAPVLSKLALMLWQYRLTSICIGLNTVL